MREIAHNAMSVKYAQKMRGRFARAHARDPWTATGALIHACMMVMGWGVWGVSGGLR